MEEHLSLLKSTFSQIVDMKESNLTILRNLDTRIKKIKCIYSEFISSNRDNLFVFTLDSFHFQSKLIDLEYEDMNRMFLSITNRMYCDYYKLFKIIVEYVIDNIPDKKLLDIIKLHDNFPVYKDLEPFKQYDFKYIQELHEIIVVILTYIHTFISNKDHDLKLYQSKNQIGLNIDSFVSTFSFNNIVMNQRAMLYINYMEFFHKLHTKYLKRFTTKVNLMLSQINNDIKLDTVENATASKKEIVNELKQQNLDKQLFNELKLSMSDNASILSSDHKTLSARSKSDSDPESIYDNYISQNDMSDVTDDGDMKVVPKFSIPKTIQEDSSVVSIDISEKGCAIPVVESEVEQFVKHIIETSVVPIIEEHVMESNEDEHIIYPISETIVEPIMPILESILETIIQAVSDTNTISEIPENISL